MIKENLKKITERAKIKSCFDSDLKEFSSSILKGWLDKCAEAANEGLTSIPLVAFRADSFFANVKIKFFLKNGLIEYLKKETEVDVILQEFIIKMSTKELIEVKNTDFDNIHMDDIFLHYYVINLSWE